LAHPVRTVGHTSAIYCPVTFPIWSGWYQIILVLGDRKEMQGILQLLCKSWGIGRTSWKGDYLGKILSWKIVFFVNFVFRQHHCLLALHWCCIFDNAYSGALNCVTCSTVYCYYCYIWLYTVVHKKRATKLLSVFLPNIDRF